MGAIDPQTKTFREFPQFVEKNLDPKKNSRVAIFCTGGIRCEKASSYMLAKGFKEVYHLKGGILKYLEEVPEEKSLWQGECFVFDQRVGVKQGVSKGELDQCYSCRQPLTKEEKDSPFYIEGVSCSRCYNQLNSKKRTRRAERQKQIELARSRGHKHIGDVSESRKNS
jgi:UPF0176 protein